MTMGIFMRAAKLPPPMPANNEKKGGFIDDITPQAILSIRCQADYASMTAKTCAPGARHQDDGADGPSIYFPRDKCLSKRYLPLMTRAMMHDGAGASFLISRRAPGA